MGRRYIYRESPEIETYNGLKALAAQVTLPSIKDETLEFMNIVSLSVQRAAKFRYLILSTNASCETFIRNLHIHLAPKYALEENQYLLKEEVEEKVLNFLNKAGTEFERTRLHISVGVELTDFVSGRPDDEAALEVLRIFSSALDGCNLQYLKFSNIAVKGEEEGIRALGKLLKSQNNLEELHLLKVGIREKAVRDLIPRTNKLRVLQFDGDPIFGGAEYISEIVSMCSELEDFRCSNSRVYTLGKGALATALGKCIQLKKLDLRDNTLFKDAICGLSKALSGLSGLTEIYLSRTYLRSKGCTELAKALELSAPSLQVLDMAGNYIEDEAARELASCIASKKRLAKLNLSENSFKDEGAIIIAKKLDNPGTNNELCEVDLHKNKIRRDGAVAIAKAVLMKPKLKVLNITGNDIYPNVRRSEVEVLFENFPNFSSGPGQKSRPVSISPIFDCRKLRYCPQIFLEPLSSSSFFATRVLGERSRDKKVVLESGKSAVSSPPSDFTITVIHTRFSDYRKNEEIRHLVLSQTSGIGCLGALDGTYVDVQVHTVDKPRYRIRKGQVTVNVLGVCDMNMKFVYILTGWEGSTADSRVLLDAINRPHGIRVPKVGSPQWKGGLMLKMCLTDIVNGGWKADNSIKVGFQRELEKGMKKLLPGTDLVANPHINLKIHVWKKDYSALSNLLSKSGIGWNDSTHTIDVFNEDVWEA
ncbi:hypothetical protein ACS0TY_007600 [Phlomoides rotata]